MSEHNEMMGRGEAPVLIMWAEVMALCRRASVGEHSARKMFCREGCEARIKLPFSAVWRYNRAMVLRDLGLPSETVRAEDVCGGP